MCRASEESQDEEHDPGQTGRYLSPLFTSLLAKRSRDYYSTVPGYILGPLEPTLFCVCDHHYMTVARHLRSREPKLAAGDVDTTRV